MKWRLVIDCSRTTRRVASSTVNRIHAGVPGSISASSVVRRPPRRHRRSTRTSCAKLVHRNQLRVENPMPLPYSPGSQVPREMTRAEMDDVLVKFVESALGQDQPVPRPALDLWAVLATALADRPLEVSLGDGDDAAGGWSG